MSQPRVTVTIGRRGQRSATISSGRTYSDRNEGIFENRKRSVKDRLGYDPRNLSPYQTSNKRQHLESTWKPRVFIEDATISTFDNAQNPEQDLRYKLDQKNFLKSKWSMDGTSSLVNDLQERISVPPHPQGARVVVRRRHLPLKSVPVLRTVPAATSDPSQIKAVRGVSVAVEQPTVATILQSLGLSKYSIMFQAEEVDMTALRNMNDDDLKELGLPMGPRKKILLALSSRK